MGSEGVDNTIGEKDTMMEPKIYPKEWTKIDNPKQIWIT